MTAKKATKQAKAPEAEVVVVTTLKTKGGAWKVAGDKVKAAQVPDLEWRLRAGIVVPASDREDE